ncbi:MAG: hypothetical protein U0183_06420 [Polyangiaceae bacterium]
MRTPKALALPSLLVVAATVLSACGSTPPFLVFRSAPGEKLASVDGDPVRTRSPGYEVFPGAKAGYHFIHSPEQWKELFPGGEVPPLPTDLDFKRKMMILAVGDGKKVQGVKITKVLDTASTVHLFVRETLEGENCKSETESNAYDAVITERLDKNIQVHVEMEPGKSCGAPPSAKVMCRVGSGSSWEPKIAAQPGETVECEAVPQVNGTFAIVDQHWRFATVPAGSATKMTFSKNNTHVTFPVDGFGSYVVEFDMTDDAGRKGMGQGTAEVLPPKDNDTYVQLAWAHFDASDDPSTFPRVSLKIAEDGKPNPKVCAKDVPKKPDFCDIREQAPTVLFHLKGSREKFLVDANYMDERAKGGPYICVRTFFNGAKVADQCDDVPRPADSVWTVGLLDAKTGQIGAPPPPPPPAEEAPPSKKKK